MGTRWAWTVVAIAACGGDGDSRGSTAWDPGSSDDGGSSLSTTQSADDAATSVDDDGGKTTSATTSATTDPDDDTGGSSDGGTTGEPLDCATIGYTGYCDGDVLVWCENEQIMMHDCAADGEVCGFQSDRIGYNCLPAGGGGFGYPVGDTSTWPAGGWTVTQVLGHYLNFGSFVGGHLAEDIANGEAATANAPVYSVADGTVLYAGANASTYVNVVLIEHAHPDGGTICSFYGHLGSVSVGEGDVVARGQQIANVLDWQAYFGDANSHLHYVLLSAELCAASDAANGALICGYDDTPGPNGIVDLDTEPFSYTSVGDVCGDQNYPDGFISPAQFIDQHHY
jgi:murein DD-endopeptidase MepM/ murein hydrolase activator NlpD